MAKGFKYAKLILDEPRSIYYSGQALSGHIECELSEPVNYSVINVTFIGEANVFWTETEYEEYNGIRRNVEVKYSSHEEYFNVTQRIAGGMGIVNLQPGIHNVPFQFQIPYASPSSFNGERGSVSYKVIAYIEYPDPTIERDELEKEFEVVAPLDLNKGNEFKQPIDIDFEEYYSCCCSSSAMNVTVHIPATGFCPGQAIPITVDASNESHVEIKKIIFQLVQKECYHSREPQSDYIPPEEILEVIKTAPVLGNTKREMTYELVVPDMIAPNLENCSIIDVGFFLKMTIQLSGCNDDLEDETEIRLGLVPLESLIGDRHYQHPMQSDLPQAAIPDVPYIVPAPIQNNMAYPTVTPIHNSTAYPTATSYPNTNGGYPNPQPGYPNPQQSYPNPQQGYPNPSGGFPHQTGGYPNPIGGYPNPTGPYPNTSPYPRNPYPNNEGIALGNMTNNQVGFVKPQASLNNAYPSANAPGYPGNMGSQGYAPYQTYGNPSAPPS